MEFGLMKEFLLTCDRMLYLNSGVDFYEIMSAHLIDQEFCGPCVSITDTLRQFNGIQQDRLPNFLG